MNLNLSYNSVGLYQMSKLMCIPCTIIIETILETRQQNLTIIMFISLFMIIFGVSLFAIHESALEAAQTSQVWGYIWLLLAIITTSLSQVLFS